MPNSTRRAHIGLWILQGILAALFLFAGGFKLMLPAAALAQASPLPPLFLKLIALCEVAGALGLVLPGAFRIRQELMPLAAAGLTLIMAGATVLTFATQGVAPALFPLATGILTTIVARGRGVAGHAPGGLGHGELRPAGR